MPFGASAARPAAWVSFWAITPLASVWKAATRCRNDCVPGAELAVGSWASSASIPPTTLAMIPAAGVLSKESTVRPEAVAVAWIRLSITAGSLRLTVPVVAMNRSVSAPKALVITSEVARPAGLSGRPMRRAAASWATR